MRTHWLIFLLLIGGAFAFASSRNSPEPAPVRPETPRRRHAESGAIKGQVLDAEGGSVSEAEVLALDTSKGMGKVPMTYTDERGAFEFKRLAPGTYKISVSKQEDGYPPTDFPFYAVGYPAVPEVSVAAGQTVSDVVVHLGPKAARLTGRVVDAATHRLIPGRDVRITLRRVDDPDNTYVTAPGADGKIDILAPPMPFTVEVSASGYETWRYGREGSRGGADPLQMKPAESRDLKVSLRRHR